MNDEGVFFCEKSGRFLLGKNVSFFCGFALFLNGRFMDGEVAEFQDMI